MALRRGGPKILVIVLAGGEGKRLMPLTRDRAKPGVPFGGIYRLIDFALSNVVNSGYLKIVVLTQYKSHSLDRHVTKTWRMSTMLGNYVAPIPAQQRIDKSWYSGSADAIYQSLNTITDEKPDIVVVVGADHVYRMDFSQMVDQHIASGAGVTVAAIRQPISTADQFGVIEVDAADHSKIAAFREKPTDAVLASMGNYVFDAKVLIDAVTKDAQDADSKHDMGGDIVPALVAQERAYTYDFKDNVIPGGTERDQGYWRDVGTLDSYFEAHMDLVSVEPEFNLYNYDWPIWTDQVQAPGAKFVIRGRAEDSIVNAGCIISGGEVDRTVLSPNVKVDKWAQVSESVLMDSVQIGKNAVVRRAILDKHAVVPDGVQIGVDQDHDRARGLAVSDTGITVVGKDVVVPRD